MSVANTRHANHIEPGAACTASLGDPSPRGRRTPVVALAICVALTMLATLPTAGHAQIATAQQKCVNALNKGYEKIAKTDDKAVLACLKAGARGELSEPTVDACAIADSTGKVAKARAKTNALEVKKCTPPLPPFAYSSASAVGDAAVAESLGFVRDLFGDDLDAAILSAGGATKDASKCQLAVAKQADKCTQTLAKEFNKCKKAALAGKNGTPVVDRDSLRARCHDDASGGVPDDKGKIAKACDQKLSARVDKSCAGVDIATAFPGDCSGAGDPPACIREYARCRTCRGLNRADWLQSDCDLTDNGLVDGSCAPLCGDGVAEAPEQCDDGNVVDADGCDSSCQIELPFAIEVVDQNILQNISVGNVGYDDLYDRLTLFADEIAAAQPDIVTLQEAVLGGAGTASFLVADLAARYALTYFAAEYGFVSGNAVLSRWPVSLHEQELLPSLAAVPSFPDRRFAARVEVDSPVGPLDVYAMHLCAGSIGCTMPDRTVQAQAFLDFVDATHISSHPAIVGADFNAHTGAPGDADPNNDPPIDLLQAAGWTSVFDGADAPCDVPTDRSGCTSSIDDLTVTADTTDRRIDNVMTVAASAAGPLPPATQIAETGATERFADTPGVDPNAECHFEPRLPCADDGDCPPSSSCHPNDFCVRDVPVVCTTNADCPGDIAADACRTTLWISDHVGVRTSLELLPLP